MKMKAETKEKLFIGTVLVVVSFLVTFGACFLTGNSTIGTVIGVVSYLLLLAAMGIESDNEKRKGSVDARKEVYDSLVDQGVQVNYLDRPWKKGCRIDPATGIMIEPGV